MLQPDSTRIEESQNGVDLKTPVSETQREMLTDSVSSDSGTATNSVDEDDLDRWEPSPPKVLMDDNNAVPLELHSQIQLYATNEFARLLLFFKTRTDKM